MCGQHQKPMTSTATWTGSKVRPVFLNFGPQAGGYWRDTKNHPVLFLFQPLSQTKLILSLPHGSCGFPQHCR